MHQCHIRLAPPIVDSTWFPQWPVFQRSCQSGITSETNRPGWHNGTDLENPHSPCQSVGDWACMRRNGCSTSALEKREGDGRRRVERYPHMPRAACLDFDRSPERVGQLTEGQQQVCSNAHLAPPARSCRG